MQFRHPPGLFTIAHTSESGRLEYVNVFVKLGSYKGEKMQLITVLLVE